MFKRALLLLAVLSVGCVKTLPIPEGQPPHIVDPLAAWARNVDEHVDDEGRIDFAGIKKDPEDLETWVAYIATVSPTKTPDKFPTEDDQLSFWLNSYNALAMYAALRSGVKPEQTRRFFAGQRITIGGQEMTLKALENDVIRKIGDPRVHFALNCMSVGCPRLPREPWDAEKLQEQLDAAATEFFNSDKYVKLEDARKTVRFSAILERYKEDFLHDSPSLIAYANKYREEGKKIPDGYAMEFMPFDWTRNDQPGPGGQEHADKTVPTAPQ